MGSKRSMLTNGLGEVLAAEVPKALRFVDLFTGSGTVACFVATKWARPVVASDLQSYAVALADSIVSRDTAVTDTTFLERWIDRATEKARAHSTYNECVLLQQRITELNISSVAVDARMICQSSQCGPVLRAYGGYYFSPLQALAIDSLRSSLPRDQNAKRVALAALIQTASRIAAAPGHTAQPFKPTQTAGRFLAEAWTRPVLPELRRFFEGIAAQSAMAPGYVVRGDAVEVASELKEGDLAFIDPPYSSVHYSRFYHVLETISVGRAVEVSGEGRYPPSNLRPQSDFSLRTQSGKALNQLFSCLSKVGASAIVTFPAHQASNGLSGSAVIGIAEKHFKIQGEKISSRFSTMGGNTRIRDARLSTEELILTLRPS